MKRVKMVLAYDGTNYCGWQFQTNGITVEEVLGRALSELLEEAKKMDRLFEIYEAKKATACIPKDA